ncbi:ABC transporter ATP-binding protein [Egibacter rhizosphaerae]|uniref:ABC transporter ATP-binding protein n=1 Tax=Egibacter rhizosphaerae TaxID=1670831 RepID=A0A411YE32_9ACTN|nr:ATP-binding cassette domain-containing protein [Egibacter rhizosphaerae]QBI19430.1 ABC transporter ATP-binding protein [Egibacter rhizosphaerae]
MLELVDLERRFGDVVALGGLSFAVPQGQVFGFVGANGAGKTTAMRIVMGVGAADRGEVRWCGAPVDAATRRRFGYMPEERGLYPKMAVRRQLAYLARLHGFARGDADRAARGWLERLGLSERAEDALEDLSLGNQQRVQLIAAFVHGPELLVLDEPFSGLDPLGIDAMSRVVRDAAANGAAVLFSSHQLDLVEQLCDGVAIIDDGRLVAVGTVDELRRGNGDRLLRVRVVGSSGALVGGWVDELAGVRVRGREGGVLLELDPDLDHGVVLDAARAAGSVEHFGFVHLSLAERYREVVTERHQARVGGPLAEVG